MKIEFGAGETPTKIDFKTCDVRNLPTVDFVCPAWEIDNLVSQNSVDEIFSRHFFEHLTFRQGELVLKKWYKVLKPSGSMEIILPNMSFHVEQWNNNKNLKHARAGLWGWQRGELDDTWDTHKSGYNLQQLSELLERFNFCNIHSQRPLTDPHLHIKCNVKNK